MREITLFEAKDGFRFETEEDCLEHEDFLAVPDEVVGLFQTWDINLKPLEFSRKSMRWLESAYYIYAPSMDAKEAINYYCERWGLRNAFESYDGSAFAQYDEVSEDFFDMEQRIADIKSDMAEMRKFVKGEK